jgi:hypothetical protein
MGFCCGAAMMVRVRAKELRRIKSTCHNCNITRLIRFMIFIAYRLLTGVQSASGGRRRSSRNATPTAAKAHRRSPIHILEDTHTIKAIGI